MSSKPNFFILGAPKCGTTALASYLDQHPDILFSRPKETNYFNTDHQEQKLFKHKLDYLRRAYAHGNNEEVVGEGSVWYLFSEVAVNNILQFNSQARFIVMLRNPIDMVYALHGTFLLGLMETEEDFEVAWAMQDERRLGNQLPINCPEPKLLQYGKVGRLGEQVQRLLKTVPKDRVHFILFDELKQNTKNTYLDVLEFLGAAYYGREDFPVVNESSKIRNRPLAKFLNKLTQNDTLHHLKVRMGLPMGKGPLKSILKKNRKSQKRNSLDPHFREELKAYFRSDIELLQSLINKDLRNWLS